LEKGKIKCVEELEVFRKSHQLTLKIYDVTKGFPSSEKFGLVTQMRRASASIAANLFEGSHRINRKEFRQFAGISKGSTGEMKYHLLLAKDLGYVADNEYAILKNDLEEISKMLNGLIVSLSNFDRNS
jgi:four helix bundle protein